MTRFLRSRKVLFILAVGILVALATWAAPRIVRAHWAHRSSNAVRRGLRLADDLGCHSCHGESGRGGLADPTALTGSVPAWSGGVWMSYVDNEEQIRQFILDGVSETRRTSAMARAEREAATIRMPAYREWLGGSDLADLVAAFKVLARMALPETGTPERDGLELAERWGCFSCHGVAGSGGLANPGSYAGFVPGWYGADYRHLVRDREEFDLWIRQGAIPRFEGDPLASHFARRQRISMPAYRELSDAELDALWAYFVWLAATDGGHRLGPGSP